MKARVFLTLVFSLFLLAVLVGQAQGPEPQAILGTGFTYQGQLKSGGMPVNGTCDLQFSLWDAATAGTQIGTTQTKAAVSVAKGLFTTQIDFGVGAFQGNARYLESAVRCPAGSGSYTTLSPRQALTPTPYALYAVKVAGGAGSGLDADTLDGQHANGFWRLSGNSSTTPGGDFIGTTDNQALEFKANGARALRLEPNTTSPNVIGGYSDNAVFAGVYAATIAGGGKSGYENLVTDNFGVIGGGGNNGAGDDDLILSDAEAATVGGGWGNIASGPYATVGGGYSNNASDLATVGGGLDNSATGNGATVSGGRVNHATSQDAVVGGGSNNMASGEYATVGGGESNAASGVHATVGGGYSNTSSAERATVGGGESNTSSGLTSTVGGGHSSIASGSYATVGGGDTNTASGWGSTVAGGWWNIASGFSATVPGGGLNTAQGDYSFAAGHGAKANSAGCFVWADSTNGDFACNTTNLFAVRATGGVSLTVDSGGGGLRVQPNATSPNIIGGYSGNTVTAGAYGATIAGGGREDGYSNQVTGIFGTVGGGSGNTASGDSTVGGGHSNTASGGDATVAGGYVNTASNWDATVGGGSWNTASGQAATVPGGGLNIAQGDYSFAAGYRARAYTTGCFVWGDSTKADVTCDVVDRWVARASGGVYFYTNAAMTSGVRVAAGGGSWSSVSDRNLKANFAPVDGKDVLRKLANIPVDTWNYKSQDAAIRHIGPVAQDFYSAFGVGEDDTHITTIDADGVALAAIQGLYEIVQEKDARIATLEAQNADLQSRMTELESLVAQLAQK